MLMTKCTSIKRDGTQCRAFALTGLEPPRCLFHTEKLVLGTRVYTSEWDMRRKIKLLNRQLSSLCHIKDVPVRARLTLDIMKQLDLLEEKLKELEHPKPLTFAEKRAAVEGKVG